MNYRLRLEPETPTEGPVINEKLLKKLFASPNKVNTVKGMNPKEIRDWIEVLRSLGVEPKDFIVKKKEEDKPKTRQFNALEVFGILMALSLPVAYFEQWLLHSFK